MDNFFVIIPFLCVGISLNMETAQSTSNAVGPEHSLYLDLFKNYRTESRPVINANDKVVVTFALALNQLLDLDEKNQVLSTSLWIYEEWRDELLVWSPRNYNNQQTIMIPASSIWLPDIFIFNAAGDNTNGFVHVNGSKVSVSHNGHVGWMVPLMVKSACAVDVTYFPYDRQTCSVKFGSWIYDIDQLDMIVDATKPDMDYYVMNSEYDLENVSISRGILNSTCCPGEGSHSIVQLEIQIKRKSLFYDYIVIAPTIMLCVLTLASFLLPCDKGEKIAIGLTVFLTLYVLQLRIADNVPDTNSTPILGVFMLVVMTFNCVSLIMATVVMNVKKRGDTDTCPEVPRWLFLVCHHALGRIVCTVWKEDVPLRQMSGLEAVVEQETAFDGADHCEETPSETCGNTGIPEETVSERRGNTGIPEERFGNEDERPKKNNDHLSQNGGGSKDDADKTDGHSMSNDGRDTQHRPYTFSTFHPNQIQTQSETTTTTPSTEDDTFSNFLPPQRDQTRASPQGVTGHDGVRKRKVAPSLKQNSPEEDDDDDEDDGDKMEAETLLPTSPLQASLFERSKRVNLAKRRWFYVAEVIDKFSFLVYLVLLTISIFTVLFLVPVVFRKDGK